MNKITAIERLIDLLRKHLSDRPSLINEIMTTLGRATSPTVIEHLSTALSFVQKARLSASQQGASRT